MFFLFKNTKNLIKKRLNKIKKNSTKYLHHEISRTNYNLPICGLIEI